MNLKLPVSWGPATIVTVALIAVAAVAGGIITATDPHTLSFPAYMNDLKGLATGSAVLAIGRGIYSSAGIPTSISSPILGAATALEPLLGTKIGAIVDPLVTDAEEIAAPPDPTIAPSTAASAGTVVERRPTAPADPPLADAPTATDTPVA